MADSVTVRTLARERARELVAAPRDPAAVRRGLRRALSQRLPLRLPRVHGLFGLTEVEPRLGGLALGAGQLGLQLLEAFLELGDSPPFLTQMLAGL